MIDGGSQANDRGIQPDPTVDAAFLQVADDIDQIAQAIRDFLDVRPSWTERSRASEELQKQPSFAEDHDTGWGPVPVQDVWLFANLSIVVAEDHLVAMAAAIRTEFTAYAPLSLSRTVLAAAATAWYLLEPNIDVRERIRRGWNTRLASCTEMMATFGDKSSDGFKHFENRRIAIKAAAERHGFNVTDPPWKQQNIGSSGWFIGSRPPREGPLIADVLKSVGDIGRDLYRYTSAVVHAQPHALLLVMIGEEKTAVGPDVGREVLVGNDLGKLLLYVTGSVFAVHGAITHACDLYGRSHAEWRQVLSPVMLRWAKIMRRSSPNQGVGEVARLLGLWVPTMSTHVR